MLPIPARLMQPHDTCPLCNGQSVLSHNRPEWIPTSQPQIRHGHFIVIYPDLWWDCPRLPQRGFPARLSQ